MRPGKTGAEVPWREDERSIRGEEKRGDERQEEVMAEGEERVDRWVDVNQKILKYFF